MQEKRKQYVEYIGQRCQRYRASSKERSLIDRSLQIVIIVGSVSLPVLLNIANFPKAIPTALSIVIAASAALSQYFQFGEWGRIHRSTHLQLDNELEDYGLGTGKYQGLGEEEAFVLFRKDTAAILNEHVRLVSSLQKQALYPKPGEIQVLPAKQGNVPLGDEAK